MTGETFGYSAPSLDRPAPAPHFARPAVWAALLVWLLYLVLAVVDALTLGLSFPFTWLFQMGLCLVAGALAGWLNDRQPTATTRYGRLGAIAGLLVPVFSTLTVLLLGLVLGFSTLGLSLAGGALACICLPVTLHVALGAGWLGGWFYKVLAGRS